LLKARRERCDDSIFLADEIPDRLCWLCNSWQTVIEWAFVTPVLISRDTALGLLFAQVA
jgi:hypothetical protein